MHRPTRALLLLVAALMLVQGLPASGSRAATISAVSLFLPLVSCPTCTGQPPTPPVDASAYEARVIELVNQARLAVGCPTATPNSALMAATRAWSDYMDRTGDYSHGTYEQFQQRYAAYPGSVLENIAGAPTPELVFSAWYDSPAHRGNMLFCYSPTDPSYDPARHFEIGVGYVDGYWTLALGWYTPY